MWRPLVVMFVLGGWSVAHCVLVGTALGAWVKRQGDGTQTLLLCIGMAHLASTLLCLASTAMSRSWWRAAAALAVGHAVGLTAVNVKAGVPWLDAETWCLVVSAAFSVACGKRSAALYAWVCSYYDVACLTEVADPYPEDCPVCLEALVNAVRLPCTHQFHKACIRRWWMEQRVTQPPSCPVCRSQDRGGKLSAPPCGACCTIVCLRPSTAAVTG